MAVEIEVKRIAQESDEKHMKILDSLEEYYRGDVTIGYIAEKARIPLRAIIEFMRAHRLPYDSSERDREEGLKKISAMRKTT